MDIEIFVKSEAGRVSTLGEYALGKEEAEKLKTAWSRYLTAPSSNRGGTYKYDKGNGGEGMLLLRFDEIVLIR